MAKDSYWTTGRFAAYHGLNRQTVSRLCQNGDLPAIQDRARGPWRIKAEDALKYIPIPVGHPHPQPPDGYWGTAQIAGHHRVSKEAVRRWFRDGKMDGIQEYSHGPWLAKEEDAKKRPRRRSSQPSAL
jgi:predicted site-specific integrase-resolvase